MSKQAKAKAEQGYDPKPVLRTCSNCHYYKSDKIIGKWLYEEEKNIRCGLGGFAVKKNGTCNRHIFFDDNVKFLGKEKGIVITK